MKYQNLKIEIESFLEDLNTIPREKTTRHLTLAKTSLESANLWVENLISKTNLLEKDEVKDICLLFNYETEKTNYKSEFSEDINLYLKTYIGHFTSRLSALVQNQMEIISLVDSHSSVEYIYEVGLANERVYIHLKEACMWLNK